MEKNELKRERAERYSYTKIGENTSTLEAVGGA